MVWFIGAVVAVFAVLWLLRRLGQVSSAQARKLVEGGARLIDVRTPEEFEQGRIKGAKNVPLRDLAARLAELEPKDAPVVVYCQSGTRSAVAKSILTRAGFTAVFNLGSINRW